MSSKSSSPRDVADSVSFEQQSTEEHVYTSLHAFVLDTVNGPAPKLVSKYNISGLRKPLHPDPLKKAPYGISMNTHEFAEVAFDMSTETVPMFLVAVMGSFPSLVTEFYREMYCQWTTFVQKSTVFLASRESMPEHKKERVLAQLNHIVASYARMSRMFISTARCTRKSADPCGLIQNVVRAWVQKFYCELDKTLELVDTLTTPVAPRGLVVVDEKQDSDVSSSSDLDAKFAALEIRIRALQKGMAEVRSIGQLEFPQHPVSAANTSKQDVEFMIKDVFGTSFVN